MTIDPDTTNPSEIANPATDGSTALRAAYRIMIRVSLSPFARAVST